MRFSGARAARIAQREKARRTRRPTVLPRMREPSDLQYRADLLAVARSAQREIVGQLEPWLRARADGARLDGPADELKALFARIRIKVDEAAARVAPGLATRFVRVGEQRNRDAMNAQYRTVLKVDPFKSAKGLERTMQARARANVDLIKSIPTELLDDVEATVAPRVAEGVRVEEIMKRIRERFDVSDSRAQLIARDQVGKYNGELAQARAEGLGVREYVWSTSKDQRVRVDHAELEGTVQRYDTPPVVDVRTNRRGNPGEDYQCRCQALPRVDALLDALGVDDVELDILTN